MRAFGGFLIGLGVAGFVAVLAIGGALAARGDEKPVMVDTKVTKETTIVKEVAQPLPADAKGARGAGNEGTGADRAPAPAPRITTKDTSTSKDTAERSPSRRAGQVPGDFPALCMLLVVLGVGVRFPQVFADPAAGGLSSMRIILFGMVSLFAVLTVKAGWGAAAIADIRIDPWWAALLSATVASKAVQSFSETRLAALRAAPPDTKRA
jgi:hypothetical protein